MEEDEFLQCVRLAEQLGEGRLSGFACGGPRAPSIRSLQPMLHALDSMQRVALRVEAFFFRTILSVRTWCESVSSYLTSTINSTAVRFPRTLESYLVPGTSYRWKYHVECTGRKQSTKYIYPIVNVRVCKCAKKNT